VNAEPEWTERADKRGLDPLGMQNAGVTLYQSLLPGISNVTLRMRYYGFYCWVSEAYARAGATDEFTAWRSWVRRAEALYALALLIHRMSGIRWRVSRKLLILFRDWVSKPSIHAIMPSHTRHGPHYS
jgi:hypothetical protein